MGDLLDALAAMGISVFVVLIVVAFCILCTVLFYGAILYVILLILEHFGILAALGI